MSCPSHGDDVSRHDHLGDGRRDRSTSLDPAYDVKLGHETDDSAIALRYWYAAEPAEEHLRGEVAHGRRPRRRHNRIRHDIARQFRCCLL
jgi:hypothetical protein